MAIVSNGTTIIDNGSLAAGFGGKVLQVVSSTKTNTFVSNPGNTQVDIGLSASITPSSSSNKVLIHISLMGAGRAGANIANFRLLRGSTVIYLGDADSSRGRGFATAIDSDEYAQESNSGTFLDSPSTTSATTYKVQLRSNNTVYINRAATSQDDAGNYRTASTITLMEIGA
tara:strand:+ start:299 stop:814 length:516 start_codon:yes stop_codon:yes gene_type:complete